MHLNHLAISGFKSFPERTELAFDDGVTAIVGPNGCGKSNVIDAITWALGEQSARSLRGERMEDVIFSGSDARRPTATAEVRIQLSQVTAAIAHLNKQVGAPSGMVLQTPVSRNGTVNGNGQAVGEPRDRVPVDGAGSVENPTEENPVSLDSFNGQTITRDIELGRRLYRSGESEYLIDGRVCRLRDIQNLLMDAGVGVKAYAVIEQGRIEQILGARPTERRQLLEEAAGVTKYKSRRRAAELKLDAAQQNLTRVDDIVFEIEKHRAALKRQAAKARRYRRLRDEMRRWETVSFARRSEALRKAIDVADQQHHAATVFEQVSLASHSGLEAAQARLRIELSEVDESVTVARDSAHNHELQLERRQQQIDFDQGKAAELKTTLTVGTKSLKTLEERSHPVFKELSAQRIAHDKCVRDQDEAAGELRDTEREFVETQRVIVGHEGDLEVTRSEVFAAVSAATVLKNVVKNISLDRARIAESMSKLDAESADVRAGIDRVDTERLIFDNKVRHIRGQLEKVKANRVECESELTSSRIETEQRAQDVREREHEIVAMRARVESLEELEAGRVDYEEAARIVLGATDRIAHAGSVVDHIHVDRVHEGAVEACLGELLQYVIVDSRKDALAGVSLASANNAGRCGFLISDGAEDGPDAEVPYPGLRSFAQIATVSGSGASVVGRLLQRKWLAPSIETAMEATKVTRDPIATLDGIVVRGGELLHGGTKQGARGLLAAKREVHEFRDRVGRESDAIDQMVLALTASESEAKRVRSTLDTLNNEEHRLEKELLAGEMQLERLKEEGDRFKEKLKIISTESHQLIEKQDAIELREVEASESITRLEGEQKTAEERFTQAQDVLFSVREFVNTLGQRVVEAKTKHAALSERSAALSSDIHRLEDQTSDLRQRMDASQNANKQATLERRRLLEVVKQCERKQDDEIRAFENIRQKTVLFNEKTNELRSRIASNDEGVGVARQALDQARADVSRQEVTRATANADLSHLEQSCNETLHISLNEVEGEMERLEADGLLDPSRLILGHVSTTPMLEHELEDDLVDADDSGVSVLTDRTVPPDGHHIDADIDNMLTQLREKIDGLGPVNMMAIDQFDDLEERHKFLVTQRRDLLDSIAATGNAIKRIDKTTRERLQEAFTAVNDHFQMTFETLFGGGRAGLVLLDETDVLESGIDIIAEPPGKRLQNIQLLSGGEKALTAMAFMFAIFKYKPSPFCLLDEIDAPLDDANIARFVDMLRGLQDRTQFVLVTHNRRTMEIADRLYGVTMEEPGVSKLISVKMN